MHTLERLILFAGGAATGVGATLLVLGINQVIQDEPGAGSYFAAGTTAAFIGLAITLSRGLIKKPT